jgi:hypothetical protein
VLTASIFQVGCLTQRHNGILFAALGKRKPALGCPLLNENLSRPINVVRLRGPVLEHAELIDGLLGLDQIPATGGTDRAVIAPTLTIDAEAEFARLADPSPKHCRICMVTFNTEILYRFDEVYEPRVLIDGPGPQVAIAKEADLTALNLNRNIRILEPAAYEPSTSADISAIWHHKTRCGRPDWG